MPRMSWRTSSGSIETKVATRSRLRPSLAYGSVSTTPFARRRGDGRGIHCVGEVDRDHDGGAVGGVGDEWCGDSGCRGPVVQCTGGFPRAGISPGEPAVAEDPLQLLVKQEQGRQRRGVEGLIQARVVERVLQAEEFRDVPV